MFPAPWREPPTRHLAGHPGLNGIDHLTLSSVPLICHAAFRACRCGCTSQAATCLILESSQQFNCDSRTNNKNKWLPPVFTQREVPSWALYGQTCYGVWHYSHLSLYTRTSLSPGWTDPQSWWVREVSLPAAKLHLESGSLDPWTERFLPLAELSLRDLFSEVICPYPCQAIGHAGCWCLRLRFRHGMKYFQKGILLSAYDNQRVRQTRRW